MYIHRVVGAITALAVPVRHWQCHCQWHWHCASGTVSVSLTVSVWHWHCSCVPFLSRHRFSPKEVAGMVALGGTVQSLALPVIFHWQELERPRDRAWLTRAAEALTTRRSSQPSG